MALSIRDVDESVMARLQIRAAHDGRSIEAEVRAILSEAVSRPPNVVGLGHAVLKRFGQVGGVDLDLPSRSTQPRAPKFGLSPIPTRSQP